MEFNRILQNLILGLTLLLAVKSHSQSFSQIVVPFHKQRSFESSFNPRDNTITIQIKNTRPDELTPLYNYDNRLVRRVIFKELADQATKVTLVLRDQKVKAAVYSFEEPYRIVIDLFDQKFQEVRDPKTGIPLVETYQPQNGQTRMSDNFGYDQNPSYSPEAPYPSRPQRLARTPSQAPAKKFQASPKRRLLQPQPKSIMNPGQLIAAMEKVSSGIGSHWATYPKYIYRVQIQSLKTGKNYKSWLKRNANRAMSSGEAMADYAAQLFAFGHELKALLAYQKVLYENPLIFDKDAKHIWNIAEIHLGQGNRILAQGYYQSLIEKHSDSPLLGFAQLRLLDIQVFDAYTNNQVSNIADAVNKLDLIKTHNLPELAAQVAIRHAYWDQKPAELATLQKDPHRIPLANPKSLKYLQSAYSRAQNPKTVYFIASIVLHTKLQNTAWNQDLKNLAKQYLDKFQGSTTEPFRNTIIASAQKSINKRIETLAKAGQNHDTVKILEDLPKNLNTVKNSASLSWLVAESYRKLNLDKKALPYYKISSRLYQDPIDKFTSQFRLLQSIKNALNVERNQNHTANIKSLTGDLKFQDRQLMLLWSELFDKDKFVITTKFKDELYQSILSSTLSTSYPEILFWAWNQALAIPPNTGKVPNNWQTSYTVNEDDIYLLSRLSKKFLEIGDQSKSQQTKDLLKYISPKSFKSKQTSKLWANELTELAEIYRKNNQYLDAGRIYALTGAKSENWEKRAEALYKGGLLLYRSGRREEAVKAFEQAASDGNNLLYAELAKKRLEQLKE